MQRQPVGRDAIKLAVRERGEAIGYDRVIDLWGAPDDAFRRFFAGLLQDCPFDCFRLETPPVTTSALGRRFELVLIDSPEIDLPADPGDFRAHFDASPDEILVFDNLGGDATMIAPRPPAAGPGYAHIAGFVHLAPQSQQLALWRTVGETLQRLVGNRPLWLSTAGGGVPWLHVRLDSRPKYYVFDEHKLPPAR